MHNIDCDAHKHASTENDIKTDNFYYSIDKSDTILEVSSQLFNDTLMQLNFGKFGE